MTICKQWAWKPDDRMKSREQCLQTLIQTVDVPKEARNPVATVIRLTLDR